MTNVTSNPRRRGAPRTLFFAACGLFILCMPGVAAARPYTVVSCDSAGPFGYSSAAWTPFGNAGSAYEACPTGGGSTAGVSNRLIGMTYAGFSHSGHVFAAPPGTTITQVRWSGRAARNNCHWGAYLRALPSGAPMFGLPVGQYCDATSFDTRGWPMPFAAPEGTTRVDQLVICGAPQCQPGATIHAHVMEVTVDDPIPPSIALDGPLARGEWVSGPAGGARVAVATADNSGIRTVQVGVGPRSESEEHACNWTQTQPCPADIHTSLAPGIGDLPDGRHTLTALVGDAAGNVATQTREVLVDNTAPDPVAPQVAGGDAWRRTNDFSVSWTNPPSNTAPVVRAHWKLCTKGTCPASGHREGLGIHQIPGLHVPGPGDYRLHVWLEDAAHNAREETGVISAALRLDPEPPQLTFEPTDPSDPLRVVVNAVDHHSGVASGEIEMRASGATTWHGLATNREGSLLVAHVDDEHFRNGAYEFRAHAVDQAGNEASTGRRSDGSAATLRLPARINTRLAVGVPRVVVRRNTTPRRRHKRVIRRLDSTVVAVHGHAIRLRGFLANMDGQPIEAATIEALEKRPEGLVPVGLATTGTDGKFHYALRASRNRTLLFRYAGSRRIGSATSDFTLLVPADTAIHPDRRQVLNGQQVVFAGRITTRPLPPSGKLVEMQAHFRGRWRTFSTLRASTGGRWRFPYRFGGTVGQVTYRFRARLPAEGRYPFISGNSRVVEVVVRGP